MPRKKGVQNKRSLVLLRKLENDHNFRIVKELIELYGIGKEVVTYLAAKAHENMEKKLPPTDGFTEEEVEMYNNNYKNVIQILIRLLSYCYPKLKATEVGAGTGDKIVFNISGTPGVEARISGSKAEEEHTIH
jgi:hypothetical protein